MSEQAKHYHIVSRDIGGSGWDLYPKMFISFYEALEFVKNRERWQMSEYYSGGVKQEYRIKANGSVVYDRGQLAMEFQEYEDERFYNV